MQDSEHHTPAVRTLAIGVQVDEHAAAIDRRFEQLLQEALTRPPAPMVTEESVREGNAFMAEYRAISAATLAARIERKELLTQDELVKRLGCDQEWVSAALKGDRLFSIQASSGVEYFPAFFADEALDRRSLGLVTRVLSGLPGPLKYHFLVSKSFTLRMTPLEALATGRLNEVLVSAAGFAER